MQQDLLKLMMQAVASLATTAQQQQLSVNALTVSSDRQGQTLADFVTRQATSRDQVDLEKQMIRNLKAWNPSLNLASYLQEFEDCTVKGRVNKDKWCNILLSQLRGQVWQDWVDNKEMGDAAGYNLVKEMVLDMHGVSLMQYIKSTLRLRKD